MDQPLNRTCQFYGHTQQLLDVFSRSTIPCGKRKIHDWHCVDQHRCQKIYDVDDDHAPTPINSSIVKQHNH
jgi:hypothetical protein